MKPKKGVLTIYSAPATVDLTKGAGVEVYNEDGI